MAESTSSFNQITVVSEFELASSSQLSLGNRASLGPAELLNCAVTITVSDVRRGFFKDGKDPTKKHEAAIVVLEFEFGSQKRRSWNPFNRLSAVKIKISVDEEAEDGTEPAEDQDLRIAARYPRAAKSAGSEKEVTKGGDVSFNPSALGASVLAASLKRETQMTKSRCASLSSHMDGDMCVIWKLEEEGEAELGVPDVLACAVLLRTDGLPFSLGVQLTAPILGNLYRAQTKTPIESKHLWERKGRDGWESEWSDFDSEEFKEWIRRKTKNNWAETIVDGTNDN